MKLKKLVKRFWAGALRILSLTQLVLGVLLVDDKKAALATYDLAIGSALLQ